MSCLVIGVSIDALRSNVVNENKADIQLPGSCLYTCYKFMTMFNQIDMLITCKKRIRLVYLKFNITFLQMQMKYLFFHWMNQKQMLNIQTKN